MAKQADYERGQAVALLREYTKEDFHILHALTVKGVMRCFAEKLGYADEADFWALAGLLHDLDFEMYPGEHCVKVSVTDLELKSVKKKYKNPNFAAGCSRETIERGADMLGWELDRLISETILAMRSCETETQKQMADIRNAGAWEASPLKAPAS